MNSASRSTLIRGGTIVAWQDGGHRILEDGVVVYRGDNIVQSAGPGPASPMRSSRPAASSFAPVSSARMRMSPTMSATAWSSIPGDGISCARDF